MTVSSTAQAGLSFTGGARLARSSFLAEVEGLLAAGPGTDYYRCAEKLQRIQS